MGAFRLFVFIFLTFLFGGVLFVQSVVHHEYIHQLIFKTYGIKSNVTYNFWGETKRQLEDIFHHPLNPFAETDIKTSGAWAWATPDYSDNNTIRCNETCQLLHTQNELTASVIDIIIFVAVFFFCLYLLYKEVRSINKDADIEILKMRIDYLESEIYQNDTENNEKHMEEM